MTGPVFAPGLLLAPRHPLASDKPPRLHKHHVVVGFRPTSLTARRHHPMRVLQTLAPG